MRFLAGLLSLICLQVFPPVVGGEEPPGGTAAAEAGIRPDDLPVIRNIELLELLDLLQDIDLLLDNREDFPAEDEK